MLSADTAAKIAAGEVIVRPASVVKELVENSIDAGARKIEIYLENAGKSVIRVTDSGEGIASREVELAIQRFATSKLSSADDLERICTYGFRGEALASIGEVSELTIETQKAGEESGMLLRVKAGKILERKEIVRTPGTTVTVSNLFFNLPARRAFLKSEPYERRLLLDVVRSYALLEFEVRFDAATQRETLLAFAPAKNWTDRIVETYPALAGKNLIRIGENHPMLNLDGFLLPPDEAREQGRLQKTFFNGRPVLYRSVYRAVVEGFGATHAATAPLFILKLDSPPEMLDANIHPAKTEVRYRDERFLFDFVSQAVRKAMHREAVQTQKSLLPPVPLGSGYDNSRDNQLRLEVSSLVPADNEAAEDFISPQEQGPVAQPEHSGFWQLKNSFIMAQVPSGLIIVDQHAAHERILFEEMLERLGKNPVRQPLLFPLVVELSAEEFATFEMIADELKELGFDAKPFGKSEVIVEAFPADARMTPVELAELFREFNADSEVKLGNRERMAALIACKSAVKVGRALTQPEMESLINRLFSCKTPFFCPHGRPTVIKFSMEDLDKRFGRI